MNLKTKIILSIITVIAFVLRFYQSGNYPPLLWDEAAIGYNAYSLTETGKDEYGVTLPLIFKSFGDFKPGLYIYLAAPFIKLFGLNEIAVRLPSIIIGSLLPLLLFFTIKTIYPKSNNRALIATTILALNPFNIHYSRMAWETNVLTFELLLAALFFIKNRHLLSAFIFGLTLYTYQAGKMTSILVIIALFFTHLSLIKQQINKLTLKFILPLGLMAIPILFGLIFNQNSNRLEVISLTSYPRSDEETAQIINESGLIDYTIFHSQPSFFIRSFLGRYFNHFSPRFLLFEGDWQNPRHSAPYVGVILYPSIIFLLIGLFSKPNKFFLLWLLLAPIPAALTRDQLTATRSMSMSIPLVFFVASGIIITVQKYNSKLINLAILSAYLLSFIYYSDLYLNHMVKKSPNDFLYGYKQAAQYISKNQSKFDQIYFTDFYGQPYIYYLFYSHYSPVSYQSKANLTQTGPDIGKVEKIDNILFKGPDYNGVKSIPHTLSIFSHDEILRQGIDLKPDFNNFFKLSPINNISTFYAYETP
ncbi:MAG: phospholipid carrier-dependent glycosyltransferase [Candidatus Shapirobacteria bacterium]|jgi:4-amino-4-deoxy-L-arabinose transferase-like glycosyltransferase